MDLEPLAGVRVKGKKYCGGGRNGAKSRLQARVEQVKHENDGRIRMKWKHYMD